MSDNPELVPRPPAGVDRPQRPAPGARSAEQIRADIQREREELGTLGRGPARTRHRAHRLAPPGPRAQARAGDRRRDRRVRRRRPDGPARSPPSRAALRSGHPRPSRPGPMWAPMTGPISETKTGSEPKIWRHSSTRWRAVSGSWMCWTTQAPAPAWWRSRANSTIRSNARRRVRTRSTGVISSSRVRIGLICRAEPSHACAEPIRPPLRRYSSVSIANHILSPSRARSTAARTSVPGAPRSAARAAVSASRPDPPHAERLS